MNFRKKKDNTVKEQTNQDKELSFFCNFCMGVYFSFYSNCFHNIHFCRRDYFPYNTTYFIYDEFGTHNNRLIFF